MPELPMSLTRDELDSFNRFWQKLSRADRRLLDDLIQSAATRARSGGAPAGVSYFSYAAFLLSIINEQSQEIHRLRRIVNRLNDEIQ